MPDRTLVRLSPMSVPKAADVLADSLRERILSGEFPEGRSLPPERELVAQTRISRTTVREALRILEVQGLVRIKAGRAGGAFVQQPDESSMAASVSLLIRGRKIRIDNLLETSEGLEPFTARLAARNRTEEDLTNLEELNEELAVAKDQRAFLAGNVEWHVAVAHAGHNELLTGLLMALAPAIYSATKNESFASQDVMKLTVQAHSTIMRAIREQDEEAAARRMARHVRSYAEDVREVEHRGDAPILA